MQKSSPEVELADLDFGRLVGETCENPQMRVYLAG
jgi:hypothetical protein